VTASLAPALLHPHNFTPRARTPWGGTRLAARYKPEVGDAAQPIGESWELSSGPEFPASLEDGTPLAAWIARNPEQALGGEPRRGAPGTALLVKLLDTAEALSVQIHPSDDYGGLLPGECGKPESWYVVEREPGAGLYLGFRRGTTEREVRAALRGEGSLLPLLRFVPVEPGDFFLIDAGTPHAIGPGLLLVEPQHVTPGKRGVTYRYWDWDRRYDATGRSSSDGTPRELHVEHALSVTRWESVQADDFVARIRIRGGLPDAAGAATLLPLCGPVSVGGLVSNWLAVHRLSGTGIAPLPSLPRLCALTVLEGQVRIGTLCVERGRTAVVPASMAEAEVELSAAHAIVSSVV
jgi:mannose-6-phosphate isomerase